MKGYIENTSKEWQYALNRSVKPGGKMSIKELLEDYDKETILYSIRDNEVWKIVEE